jgi:hypothetical protein
MDKQGEGFQFEIKYIIARNPKNKIALTISGMALAKNNHVSLPSIASCGEMP